jgi:hypothetical protein
MALLVEICRECDIISDKSEWILCTSFKPACRQKGDIMSVFRVILFMFVLTSASIAAAADGGRIIGTTMAMDGKPLAHGVVYFFNEASGPPPSSDRYWRVPDEIVTTDAKGMFSAVLSAGSYYMGAIKRAKSDSQEIGPPREGDLFLPLNNENGMPRIIEVQQGKTVDLGSVTGAILFRKDLLPKNITGIAGTITDDKNRPLSGVMVFAFLTPAMVGKPLFVSEPTGKDGLYLLKVHQGGTYYLKVRNVYGGGAMKAGDILGSYGQGKPASVDVATGSVVKGIDIKGIQFPGPGPKKL